MLNLVAWHNRTFSISPRDRATQIAGLSFDASVWELWPYLTAGAAIYLPDEETRTIPSRLRDWLAAREITISFLPTPLADAVMSLDWPADSALRLLLTGGEKLNRYPSSALPFVLSNNYGPTEYTVVTTSGDVSPQNQPDAAPAIGRPIDNTQLYILDVHLQPVPVGVPGEIYIGGVGLTRGYLNRPSLTAEKFVPNPFFRDRGQRLYKTGDMARYLPDGNIEFLGRIDRQVKIRGFRIELGEIETTLLQEPLVKEAVAQIWTDQPGGARLAAYVVLKGGSDGPIVTRLRQFLKSRLPDYMIPATFFVMDSLPLTPNGKVDRKALPAPAQTRPDLEVDYTAPRTPTEETIARIWTELLSVDRVGIHDDFFSLGGHSIIGTQLVARIKDMFQVEMPLRVLFLSPTVAGLVESIEAAHWATENLPNGSSESEQYEELEL